MYENEYKYLQENKIIKELGLFQIRGWSIDNAIIIVDEIGNITKPNMLTILSRIGENSKMILLGDSNQIDLKRKTDSCINFTYEKLSQHPAFFGAFEFGLDDIVRNPLIKLIHELFEEK